MRSPAEPRVLGALLVVASALAFSLAGVFTRMINADAWTIACWRGLFGGALIALYVAWSGRGRPLRETFGLGWRGWLLATVGSLASLALILAFKLTYATAPFLAAALGWLLLRERLRRPTAVAALVSGVGVLIVAAGGLGSGNLAGDATALAMTLGSALYMILIRAFRDTPVVLAGGVSALRLFVLGWFLVDLFAVTRQDLLLLSLFGISFAVAVVVLWTEGTRLIPAAEVALLGSAETPFATLFAWLLLAELPPLASWIGGGGVLTAVVGHALHEFTRPRAPGDVGKLRPSTFARGERCDRP